MKLQVQGQRVRLRVDEAELARLLAGETVVNRTVLGAAVEFSQRLVLGTGEGASTTPSLVARDGSWHVELPRDAVEAYAGQLPCRHALTFELDLGAGERIELNFEVDVRDSMKTRSPRRRQQAPE
ncbi:hypothetical protein [Thermomonas sp.]|uniref:hypothetical protein n=1 Tax=Thermomonas sp. TaxID=1971895 RepID=UPI0024899668|nr:hypothetical protein [Thermomonas sp.]MDI1252146.1 hypothetical protein [Thermomonas sp.]